MGCCNREWSPLDFGAIGNGLVDDRTKLNDWASSGEKLTMPQGDYAFRTDGPVEFSVDGTSVNARGSRSRIFCGQRVAGHGLIDVTGNDIIIDGLRLVNDPILSLPTTAQAFGVLNRGHRNRFMNMTVLDFENGMTTSAGANELGAAAEGEFYDAWYLHNYVRVNGQGLGTPDSGSGYGEDRGDGITHWGGRCWIIGNRIVPSDDRDCRGGIFVEGLGNYALDRTGVDDQAIAFIAHNYIGIAESRNNGGGRFRRGVDVEDYRNAVVHHNIARGTAWYAFQAAGQCRGLEFSHNLAIMDCPADNANGASWMPNRAAFNLYPNGLPVDDVVFRDNRAFFTTDGYAGFNINGILTSSVRNVLIEGTRLISCPGVDHGLRDAITVYDFAAGTDITLRGNKVNGRWRYGIVATAVEKLVTEDNEIDGCSAFGISIRSSSNYSSLRDKVSNCDSGLEIVTLTGKIDGLSLSGLTTLWLSNAGVSTIEVTNSHAENGTVSDFGALTVSRWKSNFGWSYLGGAAAYNPAPVGANTIGGVSGNITVVGAVAGDHVTASWNNFAQGLVPMASVSAAGTVIASFANPTAASVDLGSGTMTVSVERE